MQIHSVGIDLGKTTFHLVALGSAGKVLAKKKFTQKQLLAYTANLQAIHRVRDRLVSRRTAVINQIRAFLLERAAWCLRRGRLSSRPRW